MPKFSRLVRSDTPPKFDDNAHQIISMMFEAVMQKMERKGIEHPEGELTWGYIDECESMLHGGTVYLEGDRLNGAVALLQEIRWASPAKLKKAYDRQVIKCASQLSWYPDIYMAEFHPLLRMIALCELCNRNEDQLRFSGLIRLAFAELPNFEFDYKRECRRRGFKLRDIPICDQDLQRRMLHNQRGNEATKQLGNRGTHLS